jgi:hypothetical protein
MTPSIFLVKLVLSLSALNVGPKFFIGKYSLVQCTTCNSSDKKIEEVLIFVPRVSRVSCRFQPLGFLQVVGEFCSFLRVLLTLQGFFLAAISPTKPRVSIP